MHAGGVKIQDCGELVNDLHRYCVVCLFLYLLRSLGFPFQNLFECVLQGDYVIKAVQVLSLARFEYDLVKLLSFSCLLNNNFTTL